MKKKVLIIGITMAAAGSEKSFLSFASVIDYNKYEVDLLLAEKKGAFLSLVPKEIRILEMGKMGEIFLIDKHNASRILTKRVLLKHPLQAFEMLPYLLQMRKAETPEQRSYAANRLWLSVMEKMPTFGGEYDMALAYWGDRTMFYMVDKVKAKKKVAWLHFDYARPPRENSLYSQYFEKCDKVVTVSKEIEHSLTEALPSVANKVITVENFVDVGEIRRRAEEFEAFSDSFEGLRLVTVGRLCPQKGYDLALPAVARLCKEGYPLRWYIIGQGDAAYHNQLTKQVKDLGMDENVVLLGVRENPYPYIKGADIYLQPSRFEGKPIAVEEAKALCVPIFVTNYVSAAEQMKHGRLGVVGKISEDGIYKGLKKLLDDPSLRDELRVSLSNSTKTDVGKDILSLF